MKNKYYIITLSSLNKLESHHIGEFDDEDSALDAANSFGRRIKLTVIWTCVESELVHLKKSIDNLIK